MAPPRRLAPPLFVVLEVPADLAPRLRCLASYMNLESEDLERVILLALRRVCARLEEGVGDE